MSDKRQALNSPVSASLQSGTAWDLRAVFITAQRASALLEGDLWECKARAVLVLAESDLELLRETPPDLRAFEEALQRRVVPDLRGVPQRFTGDERINS